MAYDHDCWHDNFFKIQAVKRHLEQELDWDLKLHQKSWILNLNLKDSESKFFYNFVKVRQHSYNIHLLQGQDGSLTSDPATTVSTFVQHYTELFKGRPVKHVSVASSPSNSCSAHFLDTYEVPSSFSHFNVASGLHDNEALEMFSPVTPAEIYSVVFNSNPHKASRPDGFNLVFFQKCWEIIGVDVTNAISDFFASSRLFKQVKASFLVLIPKSDAANKPEQFRLIALSNEIYKMISHILVNRLKPLMPKLISYHQSAFVAGRNISDNILICHDLLEAFT